MLCEDCRPHYPWPYTLQSAAKMSISKMVGATSGVRSRISGVNDFVLFDVRARSLARAARLCQRSPYPRRQNRSDRHRACLRAYRRGNAFAVLARAAELQRQGHDIINLGIGQPDLKPRPILLRPWSSFARRRAWLYRRDRDRAVARGGGGRPASPAECRGVPRSHHDLAGRQSDDVHGDHDVGEKGVDICIPTPAFRSIAR